MDYSNFIDRAFSVSSKQEFDLLALELFRHQSSCNAVYGEYVHNIGILPDKVKCIEQIPFLPVELFKTKTIVTGDSVPALFFESSGTTAPGNLSRHYVSDVKLYKKSIVHGFKRFFSNTNFCILALLPTYMEQQHSSLVYMANHLIKCSDNYDSGFYLNNYDELYDKLNQLEKKHRPALLLGVSYALLDFAVAFPRKFKNTVVMETGGMKGRRKEIVRDELHAVLCSAFGLGNIHSEYGMTELLSQAYSPGKGIFRSPPWMKISIRNISDPLEQVSHGNSGCLNIIDLANIHSCAFIATQDVGISFPDGSFCVLGRADNSDTRGCNLMICS